MLISFMLSTAETALNKFLKLDPETDERLQLLVGKVIAVEFQHFAYQVYFRINTDSINLLNHYDGIADVTLTGAPFDFLRLGRTKNAAAAVFTSGIKAQGDLEVAQHFKAVFAKLDIDWEEQLAKVAGDVIAHQVGNFMRSLSQWAQQSAHTLQQDIKEYVQEELRWLPARMELQAFFTEVDAVRNDAERLAARLLRLQQRMPGLPLS